VLALSSPCFEKRLPKFVENVRPDTQVVFINPRLFMCANAFLCFKANPLFIVDVLPTF